MSEDAPYVSPDLVLGVGFTRSQNISQATTTINSVQSIYTQWSQRFFLKFFFAARFSFPKKNFKKNLWQQVVNLITTFAFAYSSRKELKSNNRICFRLIIQKEAAVTLKFKILRPRVALTSSTQMATEATNLLLSFVTWLTKTVLAWRW